MQKLDHGVIGPSPRVPLSPAFPHFCWRPRLCSLPELRDAPPLEFVQSDRYYKAYF